MMKEVITSSGIVIRELDIPKFAKDKTLFNLLNIPHDDRRPQQIEVTINGRDVIIHPSDGWAQVGFEAKHGPNNIVFKNIHNKPLEFKYLVRYKNVRRNGRKDILDWKKENAPKRRRMNWQSLVTAQ